MPDREKFFTQKTPLYVFATRRKLKEFYLSCGEGFLPVAMSVSEFFESILFVKDRRKIPKNIRKVFLLSAIASVVDSRQGFERMLVFEKSFLAYLESSSFLFGFFDELALSCLDFEDIPLKDTYGDYEEHLAILGEIYAIYTQKLRDFGFFDLIYGQDYEILSDFFERFSCVEFQLDGFLSKQEKNILYKISSLLPVFVHIECDRYNQEHFGFLGVGLKQDFCYKINLSTSEILSETPMRANMDVDIFAFGSRLNQCALVFERITQWLNLGLDPQKLAIITPDEGFCEYLKLLDKHHNLNFARGEGLASFAYVQALKKMLQDCKQTPVVSDLHPLEWLRQETESLLATTQDSEILAGFHSEILMGYDKVAGSFDAFLPAEILELYILDLNDFRLDDVSGGQIKVMGVLESRGLCFDRVVIVDFNEEFVPSLKDSDMFLNSSTRKALQIPTLRDRQDLQKHYYLQILHNSQKVDITFVDTDSVSHSKMIDELALGEKICNGDEKYRIFPFEEKKIYKEENFIAKLPIDFKFSATRINTFFSCKRKFYYSYIKGIETPGEEQANMGSIFHNLLAKAYQNYIGQTPDIRHIREELALKIQDYPGLSATERLKLELDFKKLDKFWENECERAKNGIKILACEKGFETNIGGFDFRGIIDRIDSWQDKILLIDYKFKSKVEIQTDLEKASDFQLPIYWYGARALGYDGEIEAYFYDLKDDKYKKGGGELKNEEMLGQKIELLKDRLKDFHKEIDFVKTEDRKVCQYCPFVDICGIDASL
ncbi:PD-(D/E)XK nuclease family protein [Helicobacter sp. 11S02596-1]|uniref:PD-(D/E)XK nuclease family protein n=1 Tax=Helicobacter sp. 11S02596-1 TaxID=1476194 RepID=UPI000BA55181|nr:PD-(D/E)XK nuclease family protein [Helicobacter sp. 11S02596-1]PAF44244.1 hypothetical protein BJI48_03420 [Helicobacter sp. 11S02596-1]